MPIHKAVTEVGSRTVKARFVTAAILACCIALWHRPALGETLLEALASAYSANPVLNAQRAKLRATDAEVPRALSGYRPTLSISGEVGGASQHLATPSRRALHDVTGEPIGSDHGRTWGYGVTFEQPLFRGFRTTNAVNEAEALARAGREELRTVEQTVLTSSVTAYMDVIRNRWIMRMRTRSREFLTAELNAVERRYASGEVTKTDVAQSKSRRALAQSQLALAKSSLRTASAVYERQIGHPPSNLVAQRTPKHLLPQSMEQAIGAAEQENPTIIAAAYREQASRFAVAKIRGELLPQIHLLANYQRFDDALVAEVLGRRSSAATAESDDDLMEMAALEIDNDEAYCQAAADAPGDTAPPPTSEAMVSDLGALVVDQDDLRIA